YREPPGPTHRCRHLTRHDHRGHRRLLQAAFRAPVMAGYVSRMSTEMAQQVARWPRGETFKFYPAIKDLTLRIGASVFLGLDTDAPEAERLNRLFSAEVAAIVSIIRRPLPWTKMGRGVAARRRLSAALAAMIPERRARPGDDFFSQMCVATDEGGQSWSDAEIVDHFNFLLAAAHDTTASALSTMIWGLGAHPEWQDRLGDEVLAARDLTTPQGLGGLVQTDRVFREALRMMPPVPFILRRALRDFDWHGHRVPAGSWVYVSPALVMRDPTYFTAPERFDPDRFAPERNEGTGHRFAYAPFGGGAHKCIGMHFAGYQAKAFTAALLRQGRVSLVGGAEPDWQAVPVPLPRNGLPVRLESLAG
ncbi:MAG: cytochrome P450, partial [Pseudomonadota bacterium]